MDGFETFKGIKEKVSHVPIIFHSAYQDLRDPYEVMNEFRPFGYVTKEGSYRLLQDTIDSAVDYYRQILKNRRLLKNLRDMNVELEDKVDELEIKKDLLKTYSNRVETLLACTKEMSITADALSAVSSAAQYILHSSKSFDSTVLRAYLAPHQCRTRLLFRYRQEKGSNHGASPAAATRRRTDAH